MLPCESAILVAIDAAGSIGRTALQKIIFFATKAGVTHANYEPHYYGPYSREAASTLLNLVAAGLVQELAEAWPDGSVFGERRRYSYRLSEVGKAALQKLVPEDSPHAQKLRQIVHLCMDETGLDFHLLSLAAKIRFLQNTTGNPLSPAEIEQQAKIWDRQVNKEDVPRVAKLLESLESLQTAC